MKKFIAYATEHTCLVRVVMLLIAKELFWGIALMPMCVITRPIVRWAFNVQRSIEKMCKRILVRGGYVYSTKGGTLKYA